MQRSRLLFRAGVLLTASGLLAAPARADDWPQYRRDAGRSAASTDKLQFPLSEIWTWNSRGTDGHTPLYHSVISKGRVYFVARDGAKRLLVCADAKTGSPYWQQQLAASRLKFPISDICGPAVSDRGVVFVYDWLSGGGRFGQGSQSSGEVEKVNTFAVRAFRADNGEPAGYFPLAVMGANGILPRLSLMHDLMEGQVVRPVPPTRVGCPP